MAATQVKIFFNVFGTTDCRLNCQELGQDHTDNKTNDNAHSRAERERRGRIGERTLSSLLDRVKCGSQLTRLKHPLRQAVNHTVLSATSF